MKKENKIDLDVIRTELQKRMNYKNPFRAFRILYDGWRAEGLRHKYHTAAYYTAVWKRGWLSTKEANMLCDYIIRGWKIA